VDKEKEMIPFIPDAKQAEDRRANIIEDPYIFFLK
jgi:hypothetical protein